MVKTDSAILAAADDLDRIAQGMMRDALTLIRASRHLVAEGAQGFGLGRVRRYVTDDRPCADQVAPILAVLEGKQPAAVVAKRAEDARKRAMEKVLLAARVERTGPQWQRGGRDYKRTIRMARLIIEEVAEGVTALERGGGNVTILNGLADLVEARGCLIAGLSVNGAGGRPLPVVPDSSGNVVTFPGA